MLFSEQESDTFGSNELSTVQVPHRFRLILQSLTLVAAVCTRGTQIQRKCSTGPGVNVRACLGRRRKVETGWCMGGPLLYCSTSGVPSQSSCHGVTGDRAGSIRWVAKELLCISG